MSIGFFITGGIIFIVYVFFTMWNIFYYGKKQREEQRQLPEQQLEQQRRVENKE